MIVNLREACVSCGAPLNGRFCAQCGEKTLEGADLDWRHYLLEELPHQLFHLDGKLPRTLKSLFTRPGKLAEDFVAGRRQPFVGPLRLYLVVFIAYAVMTSLTGVDHLTLPERAALVDPTHLLERLLHARASVAWSDTAVEARIAGRTKWLSEAGTFVIYLFVALFQRLVFARLKHSYLEHLVLALNVLTFYLLVNAFGQLFILWVDSARLAYAEGMLQTTVSLLVLPIYWYLSIRRFYGLRRSWAVVRAAIMTVGTAVIATLLNIFVNAILILTA